MSKNKFLNDSLIMVLSSGIAQIILIATIPIISRLYSPSEFGVFTIFSNVVTVLIPIINARYDLLIITAKSDKRANILSSISFVISLIIILILLPVAGVYIVLHPEYMLETILVIVILLLVSLTNIFTSYLNREKNYKMLGIINISRALFMSLIQIILGYMYFGSVGLIIGFAFSYIAGVTIGYKSFKNHFKIIKNKNQIINEFIKNKNQLIFSTPSIFLNSLSFSVVIFFIGILFTNEDVGIYGMVTRILGVPITIITLGLSKIFMQSSHENYMSTGSFRGQLTSISGILIVLSLFLYLPFYFINDKLITAILGSDWVDTIFIIKIVIPMFMIRMIVSTVSLSVIVFNKQHIELIFQSIFLGVTIVGYFLTVNIGLSFLEFIVFNSIGMFLAYLAFYIMIYINAKNKNFKVKEEK
ncbi:lipopolysaccharide biosynthesis protein [Mammaliicoccus sp. Dog046]|uniref:lipopolysaccharide biosynthesis protein n=1 Tax=Mammaliicoccus sp. Dog046 TaxID=3034233 RepID=UPI002B2609D2|nr:oligosaccharide flippase family protein [Mammaliicoccus sp. Dog046]WQK85146.1 oligosaccharide flippase family protein [Mammaliicoccus sp. Dog046]